MKEFECITSFENNIKSFEALIHDASNVLSNIQYIKEQIEIDAQHSAQKAEVDKETIRQLSQKVYSLENENCDLEKRCDDLEEQNKVLKERSDSLADQLLQMPARKPDVDDKIFQWVSSLPQQIEFNSYCMIWAQQHNILKNVEPIEIEGTTTLIVRNDLLKKSDNISIDPVLKGDHIPSSYYKKIADYAKCLRNKYQDLIVIISSSGSLDDTDNINDSFFSPLYEELNKEHFLYYPIIKIPKDCSSDHALVLDVRSAFHRSCAFMLFKHPNICLNYLCVFGKGLGTSKEVKKESIKRSKKKTSPELSKNTKSPRQLLIETVKNKSGSRVFAESVCGLCHHNHMEGYMYGSVFICKFCHSKYKSIKRQAKAYLVPKGFHQ